MEAFEPPKYITSLIASVNDGAKAAQTGVLAFSLVGLYLLATAFSTTDEDLLLQHTISISQIGVQVPAVVSLAIAPVVFVVLHVLTLVRYDMLSTNLHQLQTELQALALEADQERCRQLLANVEFVQAFLAPRRSPLHSRLFRVVAWLLLAGFPVATLVAVQISSLRYQSDAIIRMQQVCILADLALLGWFSDRGRRFREPTGRTRYFGWTRYWPMALVLALDLLYLNAPGANSTTVRHGPKWSEIASQPLDLALCPMLHWGCRYLTVDNRTLVGHVWTAQSVVDLRSGQGDRAKAFAGVEGASLRDRSLRFAWLVGSRLYGANLIGADLRRASLSEADLTGANLWGANLTGSDLSSADLTGTLLLLTKLTGADLTGADLTGVDLSSTDLTGAKLNEADLTDAKVTQNQLDKACGTGARLPPNVTIKPCQSVWGVEPPWERRLHRNNLSGP